MTRLDLLSLTAEAIAALTNWGLVRRAQKAIDAGQGPALDETSDGIVTGVFPDGVRTVLAPGQAIAATACTCGSVGACRHRVAVALAYRSWHDAAGGSPAPPADVAGWSPGDLDDEALRACLGARTLARARVLRRRGSLIELRRGAAGVPPEARLSTCTVRFLVPHDPAYARCDCSVGTACEHVALAVWAFRLADARGWRGPEATVDVSDVSSPEVSDPLAAGQAFLREVLLEGAIHIPEAAGGQLARARERADAAGLTWPATILEDLDEQLQAYRHRSARYAAATVARLLGEFAARRAAIARQAELPARYILGLGEARETLLGHVRLIGLGARVGGSGHERWVEVFLCDPHAGMVLVASKAWDFRRLQEKPEDGPALAHRFVLPGVTLGTLARAELVTRSGKRLANLAIKLATTRRDSFSVNALATDWGDLPDGVVVRDLSAHAALIQARAPRWLRPRVLAEAMHVVEIADVLHVGYAPGSQTLIATVTDRLRRPLRLVWTHRGIAPYALDAAAAALASAPRFVSGPLYSGELGLEMAPVGIMTDRLVVPDLEPESSIALSPAAADRDDTPIAASLAGAWQALADGAHNGLLRTSFWGERVDRVASACGAVGLRELERSLARAADAARRLQADNRSDHRASAAHAWEAAVIRVALLRERL